MSMVIDFHTHCFPDKIAKRAIENLRYSAGGLENHTDGTIEGLREIMKKSGVDKSVVLSIATNPTQQKNVNDHAAAINSDDLIAFGSVHPDAPDALEELERIKALGLKGVKLHPEYQEFFVDDEKMKPIYKKISSLGLITIFHAGSDLGFDEPFKAMPGAIAKALKWFDTPVVAAHWGGIRFYEDVFKHLVGKDVYMDISWGCGSIPRKMAMRMIEHHGIDKFLFGSDLPWSDPKRDLNFVDTLELSEEDKDKLLYKNAEKLLGI